jgi:mono/diheme cytochrome c family protein
MTRSLGITLGILIAAGAAAHAQDAKAIDAGKKVYDAQKCATCHVIAGKGGTMTKLYPLDGVGKKLTADDIKKWLTHPEEMEAKLEKKPALKMSSKKYALKDDEVAALLAYMQSLK